MTCNIIAWRILWIVNCIRYLLNDTTVWHMAVKSFEVLIVAISTEHVFERYYSIVCGRNNWL